MTIPYPTNHRRVAFTTPDFDATYRALLEGRTAHNESDNPYFYKSAEWTAWQYGWTTRDAERVVA